MKHQLPSLPFPKNALEPVMSSETIEYHYGKHHKAYVDKLNTLIAGTQFESLSLDEIVIQASGPVYNNAGQAWNHSFFWNCLSPNRERPSGELKQLIDRDFHSFDDFANQFKQAGANLFGSGWVWLVYDNGKLSIEATSNAENPMRSGKKPILTCDVWEHAYYIDYRNERPKFLNQAFAILNWDFAAQNLNSATKRAAA